MCNKAAAVVKKERRDAMKLQLSLERMYERNDEYPTFWLPGHEPCSGPEDHNIPRSTMTCTWCKMSVSELAFAATMERKVDAGKTLCPVCKTTQLVTPAFPDLKSYIVPHRNGRTRCSGSKRNA